MKKCYLLVLLVLSTLFIALPMSTACALLNESFEAGAGAIASNWNKAGDAAREGWGGHTGQYLMAFKNYSPPGSAYQDEGASDGRLYTLEAWVWSDNPTSDTYMKLGWYNGPSLLGENTLPVSMTWEGWQKRTLSAPSLTGTNQVRITIGSTASLSTVGKFDDVSLTSAPIPEPASMLLFASGLFGLFALKRKK